jgi:8-oxo-dGTP pyrophosphatase MutT (NUDIX family)
MTSLGPGINVVVALQVGGSKAHDTKLVLQREPRTGKTCVHAGSILPNEAPVEAAVRELFSETRLNLAADDLALFSVISSYYHYQLVSTSSFTSFWHKSMSRT